jgi:hypothetical protein
MNRQRIRLWDLPTRLFHWLLVILVLASFISGKIGGNAMDWHGKFGLAILGLLTFRLVWGIVGSTYARFASFFPTPASVLAYLRGQWRGVGHNPLGALSVFGLLVLLAFQVAKWPVRQRRYRFPRSASRSDRKGLERPTDRAAQAVGQCADRPRRSAPGGDLLLHPHQEKQSSQADAHRLAGCRAGPRHLGDRRRPDRLRHRLADCSGCGLCRFRRLAADSSPGTRLGASVVSINAWRLPAGSLGSAQAHPAQIAINPCDTCRGRPCSSRQSCQTAP